MTLALGESAKRLGVASAGAVRVGQSVAMFCGPGSPLTQASGLLAPEELNRIEEFFRERASSWEAILTPYSHPGAVDWLVGRGAKFLGWEQLFYRSTSNLPEFQLTAGIRIEEVDQSGMETWVETSGRFFHGLNAPAELMQANQLMAMLPNSRYYLAIAEGKPVGASSLSLFEGIGFLGGMATAEEYRGRGIQTAMIVRRIADAAESAKTVVLGSAPAGPSARNGERLGFEALHSSLSLKLGQ